MPAIIKATGMPYILGGAWMGGTIDAAGVVAAAGAFLSELAAQAVLEARSTVEHPPRGPNR